MPRVLVTGADGFIGSWLHDALAPEGYAITEYDGAPQHYLDDGSPFHDGRARQHFLADLEDADWCIHLAARVGRLKCEEDPRDVAASNAGLTYELAGLCKAANTRMLYVSTSEAAAPTGIYGLSKAWGEQAVAWTLPDALIVRLFMPYGPGHPPGHGRAALTNFLWNAMTGRPIEVHASTTRSWCWVEDTVRGIALALREEMSLNIGRLDNECTMYEVAKLACQLAGADPQELIEVVPTPGNVNAHKRPDITPLYALGWKPRVDLEEGMERVYRWLEEHREEFAT